MVTQLQSLLRKKFVRDTLILQISKVSMTVLSVISISVTVRLMGFEGYGVWKLAFAFFTLWQTLDLTGVGLSTSTRLAMAAGKRSAGEVLDLMAFYVKVNAGWALASITFMFVLGIWVAGRLYGADTNIGWLAAWYSFTVPADALYGLALLSLQTRRLMREVAFLQNANQLVLFGSVMTAMLIRATPESLLIARLFYSYSTMFIGLWMYARMRERGDIPYPSMSAILRRAPSVPLGPYWRSSVAMALDKNVGNLYAQFPVTMVGVLIGERAAGILGTAIDFITRSSQLSAPILDNMQAVVPQYVGRGDFAGLRRNFGRVLLVMAAGGVAFYGLFALFSPLIVPLLLGEPARAAVPLVIVLAIWGAVKTVGGIFGPLYRAFGMMRSALAIKLISAAIMVPVGYLLIQAMGETGGAWMINGLFVLSVGLTAAATLPALRRWAEAEKI